MAGICSGMEQNPHLPNSFHPQCLSHYFRCLRCLGVWCIYREGLVPTCMDHTIWLQTEHITFMELVPIELSVIVWGNRWHGHHLHCNCDNEAVVHLLLSRYSRNTNVMHLLQCLFFYEAHYALHISASHSWSGRHTSQSFIM